MSHHLFEVATVRTCNDQADRLESKSNVWYFESKAVYTVPG